MKRHFGELNYELLLTFEFWMLDTCTRTLECAYDALGEMIIGIQLSLS